MSLEIPITETEHGVIRVFAINLPPHEAAAWEADTAQEERLIENALNADIIDYRHAEVIDVDAVKAIGLSTYLIDGLALPEDQIGADRARLDALSGRVLILWSTAFAETAQTLRPGRQLTLIGTYREDPAAGVFEPIQSEAAQANTINPPEDDRPAPPLPPIKIPWGLMLGIGCVAGVVALLMLLAR